ncbi:hypothetical protein C7S14_3477 [Burkholderia cepacia]|nr:hypothetical protein C7S14_3477 [Burkholderia cepacia]
MNPRLQMKQPDRPTPIGLFHSGPPLGHPSRQKARHEN